MEMFEVHITADEKIHEIGKQMGLKTIVVDLLKPDGTVLRTEHMTSQVYQCENYAQCFDKVAEWVYLIGQKTEVIRSKIESAYYPHYFDRTLYMETHFISDEMKYPTSKNPRKDYLMATERTDCDYEAFKAKWPDDKIELCLWDTYIAEDRDWFSLFSKNALQSV